MGKIGLINFYKFILFSIIAKIKSLYFRLLKKEP